MKTLLIDDLRNPENIAKSFDENGKCNALYEQGEVVVARTFVDGINQLTTNGPWDVLLLDNDLGTEREGRHVLAYLEEHVDLLPKSIILVTGNISAGADMYRGLQRLKERGLIEDFGWRR